MKRDFHSLFPETIPAADALWVTRSEWKFSNGFPAVHAGPVTFNHTRFTTLWLFLEVAVTAGKVSLVFWLEWQGGDSRLTFWTRPISFVAFATFVHTIAAFEVVGVSRVKWKFSNRSAALAASPVALDHSSIVHDDLIVAYPKPWDTLIW